MDLLKKANDYIASKKHEVKTDYRHHFHLMPPVGWLNDPNGFVYYKGEYHLFYQFHPYDSTWGPMHWGHAKSKDLIHWEELPVALAPTEEYERDGCFSGSAIVVGEELFLMYTGHVDSLGVKKETQCLAVSDDGIHFYKKTFNPVISEKELGNHGDIAEFRDPKIFKKEDSYFCVVATKTEDNRGKILMFQSKNLIDWQFYSVVLEGKEGQGVMWECPDLFHLDGKDCLIMSPIEMKSVGIQYKNTSSTVAFIGKMDWKTGKLSVDNFHEIDRGLDFYAPQTCVNDCGERIMIAWMQMWHRNIPTHDLGHLWSGAMSFGRRLRIEDNCLLQEMIPTLYDYLELEKEVSNVVIEEFIPYELENVIKKNTYINLRVDLSETKVMTLHLSNKQSEKIELILDVASGIFSVNREHTGFFIKGIEEEILLERSMYIPLNKENVQIEILRDTSSVEVFIDKKYALTVTFYEKNSYENWEMNAVGKIEVRALEFYQIK